MVWHADAKALSKPMMTKLWDAGALCNIGYPSEIHLKLKSRETLFAHNSCFIWPIALKFCSQHGSITAVLYAGFQTDWTIKTDVMDEQDFVRFEFKMSFGRISYIAQYPSYLKWIQGIGKTELGESDHLKSPCEHAVICQNQTGIKSIALALVISCSREAFKQHLRLALKFSRLNEIHIFQCIRKIFWVEFQRKPLKFHTKYFTRTLKDIISIQYWNSKSS